MSRALERLREMFGDPLLVRSGRGYERTVRGERVLRALDALMPRLRHSARREFDPARSQERFRVASNRSRFPTTATLSRGTRLT